MALSEDEQRLLEQMEKALAADDPKLDHTLRGERTPRVLRRKRAALAGVGFLVGACLLIGGVAINGGIYWWLSVLGFILMVVGTVSALSAYEPATGGTTTPRPRPASSRSNSGDAFMTKMEERWRRRQGEDH